MPGKVRPEKRPLPLKTRQIFNTRGSILSATLPATAKQASAVRSKPTKPFDLRKEKQLPLRVKPGTRKKGSR